MAALEIHNLLCGYPNLKLRISLTLHPGDRLLLYGPNGTGKTTFVKTLLGLSPILQGNILLNKRDILKNKSIRREIFYLPETIEIPLFLKPIEYIRLMAAFYQTRVELSRLHEGMEMLGLETVAELPLKRLSLGQQRRVQLCAAYVINRTLNILDDPLIGLDQEGKSLFDALMEKLGARTIVIATARERRSGFSYSIPIQDLYLKSG